jgi:hypothetical protein
MVYRAIPTFHLGLTEKEVPDTPYLYLDREWLNAPKEQRSLRPTTVRSPLNESYKDLRDIGQALFKCLFDGQIGEFFGAYYEKYCIDSDQEGPGLRLILDFLVDPRRPNLLINLPWELLHNRRDWLLFNPKLSIVRRFNIRPQQDGANASRGIKPPMRVMFAYAEPPDKSLVKVKDSFDAALKIIRSAIELVELEVLSHVTAERLKLQVKQGHHIIHLLGHGNIETQGMFYLEESETPTADILTAREFGDWIKESAVKPRLIVLTACHSGNPSVFGILGLVTRLLDAGVEAVVSMQTALYTDEARDFTQAFYQALVTSFSIDDAVRAGRKALEKHSSPTDSGKLIHSGLENAKDSQPLGRWHPMPFTTVVNGKEIQNLLSLPAWSVPTLFLQGDGWLELELPESPFTWPIDNKAMIFVEEGRFYVDKYPVTRAEYRKFAQATDRSIPNWGKADESLLGDLFGRYFEITDVIKESWEPNLPATNVTLENARAYAAWAGKYLPTPDDWQQAALSGCSDKSALYPWGNDLGEKVCNIREGHFHQLWPVVLSGERFDSCSNAGVCDVVGNASEWTQDEDGQVYICGGSFKDWGEKCTVQTRRLITNPNLTGDSIGFRCAASLTEWMAIISRSKSESTKER